MNRQSGINNSKESNIAVDGKHVLPLSQAEVWERLNDPDVLQQCIKGCDRVTKDKYGNFHAEFNLRVGPFKKNLIAKIAVEEVNAPYHYRLTSSISSGRLGTANGGASVYLEEVSEGTLLGYEATFTVDRWFSRLGKGVLHAAASKYMQLFFDRFVSTN